MKFIITIETVMWLFSCKMFHYVDLLIAHTASKQQICGVFKNGEKNLHCKLIMRYGFNMASVTLGIAYTYLISCCKTTVIKETLGTVVI